MFLFTVGKALANDLSGVLDADGGLEKDQRKEYLNLVKMVCYILCQYMEMFEMEDTKPSTTQVVSAKVSQIEVLKLT